MEYTFVKREDGTTLLRIKSKEPITMTLGFNRIRDIQDDCDIIHSFTVIRAEKVEKVGMDNYGWFIVDSYTCEIDKAAAIKRKMEVPQSIIDYNVMMGNLADPEVEENE